MVKVEGGRVKCLESRLLVDQIMRWLCAICVRDVSLISLSNFWRLVPAGSETDESLRLYFARVFEAHFTTVDRANQIFLRALVQVQDGRSDRHHEFLQENRNKLGKLCSETSF